MTFGTRVLYGTMRAVGLLACALPRRLALALAAGFGRQVWRIYRMSPYREFVLGNIRTAYPKMTVDQADQLGSDTLAQLTRSIVELMRFPRYSTEADHLATIVGAEHLETALASGRGAIIVTAHFGNWELLGAVLARRFGPVAALVQTPSKDAFARLFIEYRHLVGVETHSNMGPQSLRPAIRSLRAGAILALLCDQHGPAREGAGTLLGQPVWVPLGPFTLARRTGAAVVPARIVRGADGQHLVIIEPALPVDLDPDRNAQSLLDRYAEWITANPDHWLWVHNRWEFPADPVAREASPSNSDATEPLGADRPDRVSSTRALGALVAGLLLVTAPPARAGELDKPVLVSYPTHLEVVDTVHPDTHGNVPLPGPADAVLRLHGRDVLVVHVPSRAEVVLVDLRPFSVTRFQTVKTFYAPELDAYGVGLEEAAGRVLLGFERTVIAHFGEQTWDFEIGFDRPDEIPYPFSTGTTLYLPAGVFVLHHGELAFEDTRASPLRWAADERPIRLLRHPAAMVADMGGATLYVAEKGDDGKGFLARIDAGTRRVLAQVAAPAPLSSLAWVDARTLAVLAGSRIGLFDVTKGTFVRWFTLPGKHPLGLFSAR